MMIFGYSLNMMEPYGPYVRTKKDELCKMLLKKIEKLYYFNRRRHAKGGETKRNEYDMLKENCEEGNWYVKKMFPHQEYEKEKNLKDDWGNVQISEHGEITQDGKVHRTYISKVSS